MMALSVFLSNMSYNQSRQAEKENEQNKFLLLTSKFKILNSQVYNTTAARIFSLKTVDV